MVAVIAATAPVVEHIAPAPVVLAVRAGLRGVAPQAGRALLSPSQHRQHVSAVFRRRRAHTVLPSAARAVGPRAPSSWMGSCLETFQCYQRRCEMVLAGMKEPGADPSLFTIISLESVIEECAVVFFIPFLMAMFNDEPVEEVPFVVSICATAPFVRCDTGAHAGDAGAVHHVALCR